LPQILKEDLPRVLGVYLINVANCFVGNLFAAHQKDFSVFLWQYLTAVSVIIDFPYPVKIVSHLSFPPMQREATRQKRAKSHLKPLQQCRLR
jgi:hypothetical protein